MSALDAFIIANHNWLAWVIPLALVGLVKAIIWKGSEIYSVKDTDQDGWNGTY